MQVGSANSTRTTAIILKSGNSLPPGKAESLQPSQDRPSTRDLAKSIDPSNMSRNEIAALGDALARSSDTELGMFFLAQSMILVNENGNFRTANESDAIMNEKFNLFDSLDDQIEFAKSRNVSTETLIKAKEFLENLQQIGANPELNLYA